MNKKFTWSLVIMVLVFSISFFAFHSVQSTVKTEVVSTLGQVEEASAAFSAKAENGNNASPSVSASKAADNLTYDKGQAVIISATAPDDKKVETVPSSPVSNNQPMIKENKTASIPVSRSGQPTDIYKYPKLSKVNGSLDNFGIEI